MTFYHIPDCLAAEDTVFSSALSSRGLYTLNSSTRASFNETLFHRFYGKFLHKKIRHTRYFYLICLNLPCGFRCCLPGRCPFPTQRVIGCALNCYCHASSGTADAMVSATSTISGPRENASVLSAVSIGSSYAFSSCSSSQRESYSSFSLCFASAPIFFAA